MQLPAAQELATTFGRAKSMCRNAQGGGAKLSAHQDRSPQLYLQSPKMYFDAHCDHSLPHVNVASETTQHTPYTVKAFDCTVKPETLDAPVGVAQTAPRPPSAAPIPPALRPAGSRQTAPALPFSRCGRFAGSPCGLGVHLYQRSLGVTRHQAPPKIVWPRIAAARCLHPPTRPSPARRVNRECGGA